MPNLKDYLFFGGKFRAKNSLRQMSQTVQATLKPYSTKKNILLKTHSQIDKNKIILLSLPTMLTRRKIFAWTMIVVLFTHSFGLNMLYDLYEIDRSLFTELFCVNKDKPEMHCDGSCMLSKMDEQSSHNHDKPALPDISQYQLVYIFQDFDFELKIDFNQKKQLYLTHYQGFYNSQYLKSIFRPPIVA